ncbi:MAG TPA: hypothetical protein VL463_11245 [Kofleriaceae bacterium]|nr:hypothetical protein [Kofleriaceae bacterium]
MDPVEREARRLLDRYLTEVVERFGLCPWAASARADLQIEIVRSPDEAAAAVARIAASSAPIGMVVLASSSITPRELQALRDACMRDDVAIADFHPRATGDDATPARLVPVLRRSPDPMLQVVRWSVLHAARRQPPAPDRADQARILAGHASDARVSVADQIAQTNHATITAHTLAALTEILDDLTRDRDAAYASCTSPSP